MTDTPAPDKAEKANKAEKSNGADRADKTRTELDARRAALFASVIKAEAALSGGTLSAETLGALSKEFADAAQSLRGVQDAQGVQEQDARVSAQSDTQSGESERPGAENTTRFFLREEPELAVPAPPGGEALPENLLIEGDNLPVLRILAREYAGKIDVIYIDPPYNTGKNAFVYGDRFFADGDKHAPYLAFMAERLQAAKPLLSRRGVIFISIDDNEQARLKILCDGVFGEENFVGTLIHQRAKGGGQAKLLVRGHDYILVYAADIGEARLSRRKVVQKRTRTVDGEPCIVNDDFLRKSFGKYGKDSDRRCFYEEIEAYKGKKKKDEIDAMLASGAYFLERVESGAAAGMHRVCKYEKISEARSKLYSIVKILSEEGKKDLETLGISGFEYPKPVELVKFLVDAASAKDSLVLDFFAGSGTTGQAVMRLNREDGGTRAFILCTSDENGICRAITRERLARAAAHESRTPHTPAPCGRIRFFSLGGE